MTSEDLARRLHRIEEMLEQLMAQPVAKEWYTTDEAARILDRSPYTVREWCRYRRVRAEKRRCGRGRSKEWIIPHEELVRIQNEGLLDLDC